MNAKYCAKCGTELSSDALFCSSCGLKLSGRVAAESAPQLESLQTFAPRISNPPQYSYKPQPNINLVSDQKVEYAEFWPRLIAWIIDLIVIGIIAMIFSVPWFHDAYYYGIVSFIVAWMYFFILETYNEGQTIGKMALNLRTVDKDTLNHSETDKYLIDSLTKGYVPLLIMDFIIGLIANNGDKEHRYRFSQKIANTVVVKTK